MDVPKSQEGEQHMEREKLIASVMPVLQGIRLYHRHEVMGMSHIPESGPVLVVVNHSLATYDITLLMVAIYLETGRLPRPLIDRLFFKIPYIGDLTRHFGAMQGSQAGATELLQNGEVVTVAPGGMREALRPSSERYQIRWDGRLGFAKLAIQTQTPIVLAACPKADDIFDVYPSTMTSFFYDRFKLPVFLARGLGPTPLPRPTKLVHFLSEPLSPPAMTQDEKELERAAKRFHAQLVKRMHELISTAIQF